MQRCAFGNTISDQPAKDLAKAIKAEPDPYSCSLLFCGVPLGREEGKAGCHGSFEDAEKEADGDGPCEVLHSCHAAENETPHDDAE